MQQNIISFDLRNNVLGSKCWWDAARCYSSFVYGNWYYFHNGNADISRICIAATSLTFSQMIMCYICVVEQSPYMRIYVCINIIIIFAVNNDNNNNLTSLMHLTNSVRIESLFSRVIWVLWAKTDQTIDHDLVYKKKHFRYINKYVISICNSLMSAAFS